ncbi:stabilizer of axonemal microtubules 2 [Halichoeres trimaculatus]|uniref:stabilizer of axonemal microtubules 2 n=1 Tax=Halichoeres trimaculatus TaxID=147232 RepID=UPI003D9E82AD
MTSKKNMDQVLWRTEYMDKFLPPFSYKMIVRTKQKHPYHALKGTSVDAATFVKTYLGPKWGKNPPKLSLKGQQRTCTAPRCPEHSNQQTDEHQPSRPCDSPEDDPEPFESTTSYRADYIAHPVQPRVRSLKPVRQSRKDLISEPTQEPVKPLSTTHTDFIAHKCQRTKPILPTAKNYEKSTEPMQSTTTMREDFKAWNVQRTCPIIPKQELNWLKKPRKKQTTQSLRAEPRETVCNSTRTHVRSQTPAESEVISGFECICNGNEESRTFWTTIVGRGGTQANGEVREEPCVDQQKNRSTVSCKADHLPKKKKRGTAATPRLASAFKTNKSQK